MADLSKAQTRVAQSDRKTTRRDSIIPSRRNVEAPQRRAANDIRSGTRGDVGGADALLDLARQFNGTSNALAERQNVLNKKDVYDNTIQGAIDFETGNIDPEKFKQNIAYKTIVTKSRATVETNAWLEKSKAGLQELRAQILASDDPTNETANAALIKTYMDKQKDLLWADEEGRVKNFGSPEAAYLVLQEGNKKAEELVAAAIADNEDDVKKLTLNAFGEGVFTRITAGEYVDIEEELAAVPAKLRAEARDTFIENAYAAADALTQGDKPDFARAAQIVRQLTNFNRVVSEKEPLPTLVSDGGGVARASVDSVPTGSLPASGAITSTHAQHQSRTKPSAGLDIDGKIGDAVTAPAGGKVLESGYDSKSGFFVRIDHGNGVVSSYSHLSKQFVKSNDQIAAGATLGEIGNSGRVSRKGGGDGSHLHYRVKVNGKDVDPQSFRYSSSSAMAAPQDTGGTPKIDAFMARSGEQPVAEETPETPGLVPIIRGRVFSLNTEQRARGLAKLEEIERAADQFADKAEAEKFENSTKQIFQMYVEGKPPSNDLIKKYVLDGDLPPSVGYQFQQMNESAQDRLTSRLTAAQEKAEQNYATEANLALLDENIKLRSGNGPTTAEGFSAYVDGLRARGKLGPRRNEEAAISGLFSAWDSGRQKVLSDPSFKIYGDRIDKAFAPQTGIAGSRGASVDMSRLADAKDMYVDLTTNKGMKAAEAYRVTMKEYGAKPTASRLADVDTKINEMSKERGR